MIRTRTRPLARAHGLFVLVAAACTAGPAPTIPPDASTDSCEPRECLALGANCGSISDGCGGTVDCGDCESPYECGGRGTPNRCQLPCERLTCESAHRDCGTLSDGCGGELDCGGCTSPEACGGSGVPNLCGCTPTTTCASIGAECGTVMDDCGRALDCGRCTPPETCGGAGRASECGCTPRSCAAAEARCGRIPDGCGGSIDCGSCSDAETCGGGGRPNQCGSGTCDPATCDELGYECGVVSDGCGDVLACGSCGEGEHCGGAGVPGVCACPSGTWYVETVDDSPNVGEWTSLAITADGAVHIVYYDRANGDLRHARRAPDGRWARETIDSEGDVGGHTSLIAAGSTLHVLYYDFDREDVRYARSSGADRWETSVVGGDYSWGPFSTLAVDSDGRARAFVAAPATGRLISATRATDGSWSTEPVSMWGSNFWYPSLAIGPDGVEHLVVYELGPGALYVRSPPSPRDPASPALSGLTVPFVSLGRGGIGTRVAGDASGDARVVHRDRETGALLYTLVPHDGGDPVTESIDAAGSTGEHHDMTIGPDGRVHVSYRGAGGLGHLVRGADGAWQREIVDDARRTGEHSSIAVDALEEVHVSYLDVTTWRLRYARRCR
jgi:hypothetical protein